MRSDVELATFLLNRIQHEKSDFQNYRFSKNFRENIFWIFKDLEDKIIIFLKNELVRFKKILKKENTQYFVQDFIQDTCEIKEAAFDIILYFLKSMKQDGLVDTLKELIFIHQRQLKSNLKQKYQCVFEGIAKQGDSTLLNNIYTDLYITQGGSEQVNTEHEVRQIEVASRRHESQEIQVECKNLFEATEQDKKIKTVLTKGVAGIGKSISVQKFVLDWAEERENQDISFIFPLPFREMNLKEKEKLSLMSLLSQFFPETEGLNLTRNDKFKVLFILDGLDECRLPLNFEGNESCRDVSSPASLDVLLTNLIKGNLLPSALIWITTRPEAASKIPPYCIDRLTEIRGFNDAQKEEYFKKRLTDENLASKIIDHVKQSKSLFIMCHIPVFCWISATVLQNILEEKINNDLKNNQSDDAVKTLQESNIEDTPKTLTQMYTHFLRFQIQQSRAKYDGEYTPDVSWDKDAILSLGKLAFHQLERNNLIFYDTDLEACGIDVSKVSVYSGMCTQIFKEEKGITVDTMYCFVHMSIQEFIAALYAHLFLDLNKKSAFSTEQENKNETLFDLLKTAVDKALESDTGHLDLFLRFLLGLSLASKKTLLRGLLTQQDGDDQSRMEIVKYIKQKLEDNLSPERSINLFYCLNELNDQTLVKEIQIHLNKGSLSSADLSPAQWSALAFVLLTSEEEMEKFELQKFKKSDECLIRLLPVIKTSRKAKLNNCNLTDRSCLAMATVLGSDSSLKNLNMNNNNLQDSGLIYLCTGLKSVKCKLEILRLSKCDLTEESCSAIASVLSSDLSSLKDLDLSNNNLQDSGVMLLSGGLKENCKLEKLRLSNCSISEEGYKALASALRSNPSHLIELDLRGNEPGQSGVKQLSDLLQGPNCQLKTLRFLGPAANEACQHVSGIVGKNPLLLRELNLSERELGDTRVIQIAALLKDKHCKFNTLKLNHNSITAEGCAALTSAFNSNPSNLIELDLSGNKLGNSGIEKICPLLENTQCILEKLKLSDCSITEEGYKALASALRSNPSHLIELDLTGNYPGQSGVEGLIDLQQGGCCKLKTIRFLKSPAAEDACDYLTKVLQKSPLLLTELDLSEDKLGDLDGEKLSALLMDSHCKLKKMKLNNCELTEKSCSVLATVLSSKTTLKELNLNNSRLLDSGVKKICEGLKNPVCELKILKLSDCSITEEGYKALASALRSNPSHLIELDLTGNDPGQSGVKELDDLLQDPNCQLKTLRLLQHPDAEEACKYLTEVLQIKNPLLLKELNLSECELGDTRVNQIAALLQDKHCKFNTLKLCDCGLTEESGSALATVLRSNPSLKELNISNNNLQDSGMKKLQNGLENTNCTLQKLR
uniref:NACHT domain-containing protein n=1 Tax=Cyprinus carpio TaxID=7962 RepID=A0A8C1XSP6_CYPCA